MNGATQTNPNKIAESFNQFFSEIGENLAKKIPNNYFEFKNYLKYPVTHSMFLFHTSESEIMKILDMTIFLPSLSNFPPSYWHLRLHKSLT